jgi:hypothetical protein
LWSKGFKATDVEKTPWAEAGLKFNIFALHTRWNGSEIAKIMGDPTYITILRDPVDRLISSMDFSGRNKVNLEELPYESYDTIPQISNAKYIVLLVNYITVRCHLHIKLCRP